MNMILILMVTPGANHRLHSVTTTHAKNTCEDRGDAFYVMDSQHTVTH